MKRAGRDVYLTGAVRDRDRLARLYAVADALVHGSGAETYGLAVAEAKLSGLSVIVPDSGGAADMAPCGSSFVYATGDAAACASAILRALRNDARRTGAKPAISTAEEHFGALFALYRQLIDRAI